MVTYYELYHNYIIWAINFKTIFSKKVSSFRNTEFLLKFTLTKVGFGCRDDREIDIEIKEIKPDLEYNCIGKIP